jgi:hypothetical protein
MTRHHHRATRRRWVGIGLVLLAAALVVDPPAAVEAVPAQASPAGPVWISLDSDPADPVGEGVDRTFLPTTHDFAAGGTDRMVTMSAGGAEHATIWLEAPVSGPPLAVGHYDTVSRWDRGPDDATIDIRIDGRLCSFIQGSFDIDELTYDDGQLATMRVRFRQECGEPEASLSGELRWDASTELPTNFPAPVPPTDEFYRAPDGTFDPSRNQLLFSKWAPVTDEDAGAFERIGDLDSVDSRPFESGAGGRVEAKAVFREPTFNIGVDLTFQWSDRQQEPRPGLYTHLPSLGDDAAAGGFGMGIPVFGCNIGTQERRDVIIDELDLGVEGGSVEDISLRFERTCGPGRRRMVGELHWQAYTPSGTPGMPTVVTSIAGDDHAVVTWAPPASAGNSPITGYQITTYRDGLATEPATAVGPTATSAMIPALQPGHLHTFKVAAVNAAGPGRRSVGSAPAMLPGPELGPFASTTAFVRQQHIDFTGRAPTAAQSSATNKALRLGTTTTQEIILTLRATPAWQDRRAAATRLYLAYLARTPDTNGLNHWVGRMNAGIPLAKVSSAFAESSEFTRKYGKLGDAAFVDRVYQNVLGRKADSGGRSYWTRRLANGTSRGNVMVHFSESSEHRRKTQPKVDAVLTYVGMLRRVPTSAELSGSSARAVRAGSPAELVRTVLRSAEYERRIG